MRTALVVLMVLAAAGCGGGAAAPNSSPTPGRVSQECVAEVGGLVEALFQLESRLNLGLSFADYGVRVGDARVAYDRIRVDRLDQACLRMASKAEEALNAYIRAYGTWNDCVQLPGCTNDSVIGQLRQEWSKASDLIRDARAALP